MPDLSTIYLGLPLKNPIVASASPLSRKLDLVRRLEDAGAAAIVMYSLFEEEIIHESHEIDFYLTRGALSHPEALDYLPPLLVDEAGPERYLRHLERVKRVVDIPVIGSLNGVSSGGWVRYARAIEEAGADALELNIYYLSTDPDLSGTELEQTYVHLVREVRAAITIPLAVKLSPFFTSIPHIARRIVDAGADGLVLFNRFYQPDIDLETLEVAPSVDLSASRDLRLPLRWTAILYRRIGADLALTGGVHGARDVIKATMAGASVAMVASELLANGIDRLPQLVKGVERWMEEHEYRSIRQMQGSMSQSTVAEPAAFERSHYMRTLHALDHKRW
jgi:dihydroorotate dehydrogenase (fumarate)